LCLQEDVADAMLEMIVGATRTLRLGNPRDVTTHVGPVIDEEARERLIGWIEKYEAAGRVRFRWDRDAPLPASGLYVPPAIIALDRASELKEEVFGPILHVVRWRADALEALLDDIAGNGTALTLGIQSRIDATAEQITARLTHGNVYVNRSMIGAVVGTQPFGGSGLSGTGPKSGGPNYLHRFVVEQAVTINTAAAGGNASLLMNDADGRIAERRSRADSG
jgi:RHH-type proline utilization regulon transcriptional repressor/proline dehydrogenase/delta 1-pyrroline-5-carboxylate dehydrogenase